jgi:5-formyltetrahydrofolate cyclo-ligase
VNPIDEMEQIRRQVWIQLQAVARPDSRFHWDFSRFIPDFEGSQECCERIRATPLYQDAGVLLVTPDNSLADFRARCLVDGKTLIVPTYGLARGFLLLERPAVPAGQESFAATLDGQEVFGRTCALSALPAPQMLITGASVINREGVRVSPGPSFFDLEWLILATLGLVDEHTPIFTIIHDCQLVDLPVTPLLYAVGADLVITPSTICHTGRPYPRPLPSAIHSLPWQIIQEVPLIQEIIG